MNPDTPVRRDSCDDVHSFAWLACIQVLRRVVRSVGSRYDANSAKSFHPVSSSILEESAGGTVPPVFGLLNFRQQSDVAVFSACG